MAALLPRRNLIPLRIRQLRQANPVNSIIGVGTTSVVRVQSFDDAINILVENGLIDPTITQYSESWLQAIIGCPTNMKFQGRQSDIYAAMDHVNSFSKTSQEIERLQKTSNLITHRSPYLIVTGTPGSGKSRFMYEVGNILQQNDNLVLATTFNNNTCYVPEDDTGLTIHQYPIVARLLFQYARKILLESWPTWCHKLNNLNKTYNLVIFLALENVVNFLKKKYSKNRAVLLIDETYFFIQSNKFMDHDIINLMRNIVSIQDHGVAVIFSAFVPILANEASIRVVQTLNMAELSSNDVEKIIISSKIQDLLKPFSIALDLDFNQTMELLYSCIGGLPRIVEGLCTELQSLRHFDILSIIDAVGCYIVNRYNPPSFELIMAAFSNKTYTPNSIINTQYGNYTVRQLQLNGLCHTHEITQTGITGQNEIRFSISLSYAQLFAAVYFKGFDSTCSSYELHIIFRQALKELLLTPMLRGHNIWEEFMRRLVILRSLRYTTPTNISLEELFHPALQHNDCLTNTQITMNRIHPQSIQYFLPPTPADVKKIPSIWYPESRFEAGVDTLMFFNRVPSSSSSLPPSIQDSDNLICVGIQNKWYHDDTTKISYSTMRKALNHFTSKMMVQGWRQNQLYFIFIINQSIYDSITSDTLHLFNEQIGIISATNDVLDKWLSPTLKLMVNRFQTLAKHEPSNDIHDHNKTEDQIHEDQKQAKTIFERLNQDDENNPLRNRHFGETKATKRTGENVQRNAQKKSNKKK